MRAFVAFVLLLATAAAWPQASNFALVKLPRGIELQIPKGWWLIGPEFNQAMQTSVEAAMDLSGIGLPAGKETNLVAANSMPRSTYAAVRVDSTIPPSMMPSDFASMGATELRELQRELQTEIPQNLRKLLPLQGNQLIDFYGVRLERISGYPAIVTEYRRSGPKGPVLVQIIQIFTQSQEIRVNLSYRESETALWKPVAARIRQSIAVRRWP